MPKTSAFTTLAGSGSDNAAEGVADGVPAGEGGSVPGEGTGDADGVGEEMQPPRAAAIPRKPAPMRLLLVVAMGKLWRISSSRG